MRRLWIFFIPLISTGAFASQLTIQTGTFLGQAPQFDSAGEVAYHGGAWYLNDGGEPGIGVSMSGNLSLFNEYGDLVRNRPWSTVGGSWEHMESAWVDPGFCYSSALNAQTFDKFDTVYGNSSCVPRPPPIDPPDILPICCLGEPHNVLSEPLILDLNGDGIHTTPPDVDFDLTGDGALDRVSWTNPGTEEGFLYLDLNRNGRIDGGQELFGDATFLPNGGRPQHGFDALAVYDTRSLVGNADGVISVSDRVWQSLRIWVDRDHDGVATFDETCTLPSVHVLSISLAYVALGPDQDYGGRSG